MPTGVPPQLPLYHFQLVASFRVPLVTVRVAVPAEQLNVGEDDAIGVVGRFLTISILITVTLSLLLPSLNATYGIPYLSMVSER